MPMEQAEDLPGSVKIKFEAAEYKFEDVIEVEQEFGADVTPKSHPVTVKRPQKPQFFCDCCNYKTSDKSNLRLHMGTHKKYRERFQCSHCTATFTAKSSLKAHMRKVHSTEKPRFSCDCCEYKNFSKYSLRMHMARHISMEFRDRVNCPICSATYFLRSEVKRHMKKVHQMNLPLEYQCCHICEKQCASPKLLKKHLKTHNKPGQLRTT